MSNNKQEKMIILGPSGSGKDFLRKSLIKLGLRYEPKVTTRPIRQNETNGDDYYFLTENEFIALERNDNIKVSDSFLINENTWYYGITKDNWHNNQLFIMTRPELESLSEEERKNSFVVFLNIDEDTRRKRITERFDSNDSIDRRINADEKDFEGFKDYDLCITDPEFEAEWILDLMY
jgi:guanylate kinase